MLGYRSNDAVITICQNNRAKSIEIREVNQIAQDLLGYGAKDLLGKPLAKILPPRIADMLAEYVEFENDANDVGHVLGKVQSFSVVGKDGKETGYRLKVVRDESTPAAIAFKLVLQDKLGLRKSAAVHDIIHQNFKGHESLDPDLGVPDRQSLAKDIELLGHYNSKSNMRSCFGILQVDHFDDLFSQYGRDACRDLVRHVATICRQSLRPDDVIGSVDGKRLGILLLDATPESGRVVFNRLRWQIAANPFILPDKATLGLSVSIVFTRIGGRIHDRDIIGECEGSINMLGHASTNILVDAEELQKRKTES